MIPGVQQVGLGRARVCVLGRHKSRGVWEVGGQVLRRGLPAWPGHRQPRGGVRKWVCVRGETGRESHQNRDRCELLLAVTYFRCYYFYLTLFTFLCIYN